MLGWEWRELEQEEGILMLKVRRGWGWRERQVRVERVMPRDWGAVRIATGWGRWRKVVRSASVRGGEVEGVDGGCDGGEVE